ncbi:glycosyltransferase [Candidatus Daviesbacteria bacterium]|nr:glycosyltransferase [Candidatus Daviesbacteria bacterium]
MTTEEFVPNLFPGLSAVKRKIASLNIPPASYLVVWTDKDHLHIMELGAESKISHEKIKQERNFPKMVISWIQKRYRVKNIKFIAAEVVADKWHKSLISDLWLKEDIVPYFIEKADAKKSRPKEDYVKDLASRFNTENIIRMRLLDKNEVEIAELVTLDDYKAVTHPDEFELLLKLAKRFKGKRMVFINATPQGGGVALMRHALIRLYRLLGVDARWHVLYALKEAFDITKTKFHNVLQAVADQETILTQEDKDLYNNWTAENADRLKDVIKGADVVIIDDPQPAGLVPFIKKFSPRSKIIYRSHIQIEAHLADKIGTPQHNTWQFIWQSIKDMDFFLSHPMKQFVPKDVPVAKLAMMGATTDALDGLNKPLSPYKLDYYHKLFDKILIESQQDFDPSKGIPDVIESYYLLRKKLKNGNLPQLVIVGHGSIDDPDGVPIYNLTMSLLRSDRYAPIAKDIKVARLPAIDQILNALLREAKVALQLSHKEGFEVKVSEALMVGTPVVAYKAGGIPLQIKDGISGYLVEVGNTREVADKLYKLFTDDEAYHNLRRGAIENVNPETTTISNAINWLFLAGELVKKGKLLGNGKTVKQLIKENGLEV